MMRRMALLVVVAGMLATGLSGTVSAAPLSKANYIVVADSICQRTLDDINEARQRVLGDLEEGEDPSDEQAEAFVDEIEPALTQQIDSLDELEPPKADAKKLKKLFKLVEKGYEAIIDDPSILNNATPPRALLKASKQAAAYGFEVCGS